MPTAALTNVLPTGGRRAALAFECTATVDQLPDWRVHFTIRLEGVHDDPQWVITALEVTRSAAVDASVGLTGKDLRAVPVEALRDEVRHWAIADGEPLGCSDPELAVADAAVQRWRSERARIVSRLTTPKPPPKLGRKRVWSDDSLRDIAEQAIALGATRPRDWLQALAETNSSSVSRMRHAIERARDGGWLAASAGQGSRQAPAPGNRLLVAHSWETSTNEIEDA